MVTQGPLMVMVYLILTTQWSVESPESAQDFLSDVNAIQTRIVESESLASAWVDSTSALYKWEGYRDYFDLTDSIRDAYGYLYRGEGAQELARRDEILESESGQTWVGFVDQGLLATAVDQQGRAAECFEKAISLNHHINNAPIRILAGEAYLKQGLLADAQVHFASAIAKAESSGDRGFIFRVRQDCVDALFDHGFLDAAVERAYLHYDTDYPLEKSWLLAQEIMYFWSLDDVESAAAKVAELASQIEDATYSEASHWEKKTFGHISGLLTLAQKTLEGDPLYSMIMAVEAADFILKSGNAAKVIQNLQPSIERFPIENFDSYSDEEKEWATWAHYVQNVCRMMLGDHASAEEGLRHLLAHSSFDSPACEPYVEANCWLGLCLYDLGRIEEALTVLEEGLDLDAASATYLPPGAVDFVDLHHVQGGKTPGFFRESMVRVYWDIQRRVNDDQGGQE